MMIGVIWEFFECSMDLIFGLDMQKDTIVNSISSVMLDPTGGNTPTAVVFSVIGYFYVKNRGNGKFAKRFIPHLKNKNADFLEQAKQEIAGIQEEVKKK